MKDAREKDKSIAKADVEEFFRKNVEEKFKPRGKNSSVAPHAPFEYQVDLFVMCKKERQKFRIGLVFIDIFSTYATVIPIKSKEPPDVLAGIMEGLKKWAINRKCFTVMRKGVYILKRL